MMWTKQTHLRHTMAVHMVMVLLVGFAVQRTECSCTFPSDLSGVWWSSRWGEMNFTSSSLVNVFNLENIGDIELECDLSSGTQYVLRSTSSIVVLGNTVDVVACLDLNKVSSIKYYYYHSTTETPYGAGSTEPVVLLVPSSPTTISSACTVTSTTGTNHILIAKGSESAAAIQCPDPMLATFDNVTIDKGSGAQCGGVGYIHMCNNRKDIRIDYSVCAEEIFYSSEGNLECVYYTSSGSTYYVNVYNFDASVDSSSTFRFSCVAIAYGSDEYVYATQYPMACDSTQTSTSVPSTPYQGGTLELVSNLTCIPTTTTTESSGGSSFILIIIIAVILLLIILLLILCIYHFYYRRRWAAFKRKITCSKDKTRKAKSARVDPVYEPEPQKPKDEVRFAPDVKTEDASSDNEMIGFKTLKERPLSGLPPASPAALSADNELMKRRLQMQSSQSTRSVATPSLLQPEVPDTDHGNTIETQTEPALASPRRLPPMETYSQDPHLDMPGTPTQEELYQ